MSDVSTDAPATGENSDDENTGGQPLGPEGEKALEAWKQRARAAEGKSKELSAAAKERDELRARLEELEANTKSEHQRALEQAVKEAEQRVLSEAEQKANSRLIKAEVRATAAGRLNDPEDAVRFIDLTEFEVNEDGEVDTKAIRSAIDALVKDKPYLSAKQRPRSDVDQGARTGSESQVQPGYGRIARAYANGENR